MRDIWNYLKRNQAFGPVMVLMLFVVIGLRGEQIKLPGSMMLLQALSQSMGWSGTTTELSLTETEKIDAFVMKEMQRHRLPGLALALVEGDQVIFMKGYGKADQSGRLVTPQTPFLLASISKPLTATAIMQLVETGRVELDAPVQRYIPEFRVADPVASSQITVRHLLLHTSGLPVTACDTRINAQSLEEYVAELQTVRLEGPVGSRHNYCSGNYNVLGRVIEKVSGLSFGDYMEQNVFAALDMRNSFVSEGDAQAAGMAQGYQFIFGVSVPTHYSYNASQLPSGYMISSAEDMSHFLISQLNDGQYDDRRLLVAETVAAMQAPGISRAREGGYGFGWVSSPVGDVPAVWHDGVNNSYHSLLLMQPQTKRGVAILMNSFNIVAYESAYQEIETGVARLMAGLEPHETSQTLGQIYLKIDVVLAVLLAIVLWPLLRIRKWHRWLMKRREAGNVPTVRVVLRAVLEILFALMFLIGIRMVIVTGLGAQSWYEVLTTFPDFVLWIWMFALILFVTGVIRLRLILQTRHVPVAKDRLILEEPLL
jgi:CubicO group peptidase (beta-lactamase class C family)